MKSTTSRSMRIAAAMIQALLRPTIIASFFLPLVVLFMFSPSWAAIYYVDAVSGNDSNTGISETTPWKTIAQVNAFGFRSGDQILFRRGQVWRERLLISSSGSPGNPIIFGAYGDGNNPTINGANIIENWTLENESNMRYYSIIPTEPSQVFENGIRMVKSISKKVVWILIIGIGIVIIKGFT